MGCSHFHVWLDPETSHDVIRNRRRGRCTQCGERLILSADQIPSDATDWKRISPVSPRVWPIEG